ncbi:hypothetical protein BHM03_00034387 [Ensete ventricosum]|nr:hypothetical protein BHM03_00034387 [Ensete ventricosum]
MHMRHYAALDYISRSISNLPFRHSIVSPELVRKENLPMAGVRNQVQMTYVELLGKSRINPKAIYGDLDVLITRVEFDSREVYHKDLFTSCVRLKTDGILYLTWACNRGAIALVVGKESVKDPILSCSDKAVVIVNATDSTLPVITVTFYGHPSRSTFVVGVIGTNGKMTMTNLV